MISGGDARPADERAAEPNATIRIGGLLLCGGRSRRMGINKLLLRLSDGGPALVEIAARAISAAASEILLSTDSPEDYGFLGLTAVSDAIAGAGPIGGLIAGLEAHRDKDWVLVSGGDLPFVDGALARALAGIAEGAREADVVMPATAGGDEPLFAMYRPCVARVLRQAADHGLFRLTRSSDPNAQFALAGARILRVGAAELLLRSARFRAEGGGPPESLVFLNINDPVQLAEARRSLSAARGAQPAAR